MLTVRDVEARERRLDQLARGLAKEAVNVREAKDPLLRLERQAYLRGLQETLAGVEAARVVLARALMRMGGGPITGAKQAADDHEEGAA